MKRMISHYATAITDAEECREEAYHSELINMCQNIIVTQSQEIETMQAWLCKWYRLCNDRQNLQGIDLKLRIRNSDAPTVCSGILYKAEVLFHVSRDLWFSACNKDVPETLISAEE